MFTQPDFIGRDSHFVSWDRDGTASHMRTPMGPMEHESHMVSRVYIEVSAREMTGRGNRRHESHRWDNDGIASQGGTPVESVQLRFHDVIMSVYDTAKREIIGCSSRCHEAQPKDCNWTAMVLPVKGVRPMKSVRQKCMTGL